MIDEPYWPSDSERGAYSNFDDYFLGATMPTVKKLATKKKKTSKAPPKRNLKAEVTLPETKSQPKSELSDYALLFYSPPGMGKTTLSAEFEDAFHMMYEPGAEDLEIYQRRPMTWPESEAYVAAVEKSKRFKNVVVDVVEEMHDQCFQAMCKRCGVDHPTDANDYGKTWDKVRRPFTTLVKRIAGLKDKGCIFLSHAAATTRKTRTGDEHEDIHPALTGKPLETIEGMMDLIGYIHSRKGIRVMQIQGDDDIMAKCRLRHHFLLTDGTKMKYIPMGNSEQQAYRNLIKAFNNEFTPEEIAAIFPQKSSKVKKKGVLAKKRK